MNCPVCRKEARAYIYYCARCAVYVHEWCWRKHVEIAHKEKK
ncbi:MAG: hypothetical protein ACE5LA_01360 [Dehalococcoidales bacterium]